MGFKSDIEIAQECDNGADHQDCSRKQVLMTNIWSSTVKYKAKIDYNLLKETDKKDGKADPGNSHQPDTGR